MIDVCCAAAEVKCISDGYIAIPIVAKIGL